MDFLRPKRASLSLDLAPLIDVVFQLLIFFMLTSSFMHPALKLTLPTAASRERVDTEQLIVSVSREGRIYVGHDEVALDQLQSALEQRLAGLDRKQVNFRGDQDMAYQLFVTVMDIARQAGARQLNIVHQPTDPDER
jgi:biopolymer transport protein ExbD